MLRLPSMGVRKVLSSSVVLGRYIKILIKGADWATVKSILRKEFKNDDLDQLMNSRVLGSSQEKISFRRR